MAEPWKTTPLSSPMLVSVAEHELLLAVADNQPGMLEKLAAEAAANASAKHNLPNADVEKAFASVLTAIGGSDYQSPVRNITPRPGQ